MNQLKVIATLLSLISGLAYAKEVEISCQDIPLQLNGVPAILKLSKEGRLKSGNFQALLVSSENEAEILEAKINSEILKEKRFEKVSLKINNWGKQYKVKEKVYTTKIKLTSDQYIGTIVKEDIAERVKEKTVYTICKATTKKVRPE